ncbi:MAG: hypothetical protein QNK31_12045, partial [Porticoccus sp.]|nr:hypothetical protein [Porticoccus sp.]
MKTVKLTMLTVTGLMLTSLTVMASDFYIYPKKGQNEQQQSKDAMECQTWATKQSGFDPTAAPPTVPQAAAPARGGALRGAALGAIVSPNSQKGAAIGAGVGAAVQGRRNAAALEEQRAAQAQVSGDYAQK